MLIKKNALTMILLTRPLGQWRRLSPGQGQFSGFTSPSLHMGCTRWQEALPRGHWETRAINYFFHSGFSGKLYFIHILQSYRKDSWSIALWFQKFSICSFPSNNIVPLCFLMRLGGNSYSLAKNQLSVLWILLFPIH
jgi:hypothetical protein